VIVFTLFLSYPAVSRQIIAYFRCVGISNGYETIYYFRTSLSEQCFDSAWFQGLGPIIVALLLYPFGIPLVLLWAIVHFRDRHREAKVIYALGLAYSGFHPEFWWFELADMLHKLTLTCLIALLPTTYGQVIAALLISAIYTVVLIICLPYLRDYDNLFHILSQMEVFLLVLAMQCGGAVGGVNSGSVTDVLVSGLLILMVTFVFTVFLIVVVKYLRLAYLRKRLKSKASSMSNLQLGAAAGDLSQNNNSKEKDDSSGDKSEKAVNHLIRLPSQNR